MAKINFKQKMTFFLPIIVFYLLALFSKMVATKLFKDDAQFQDGVEFVLSWIGIFIIIASFPLTTVAVLTFFIAMACISVHLHYQERIKEAQWKFDKRKTTPKKETRHWFFKWLEDMEYKYYLLSHSTKTIL